MIRRLFNIQPVNPKYCREGRRIKHKQSHNVQRVVRKDGGSLRIKKLHDLAGRRLTSEEFLKVHEELWKEGPKVKYLNPDSWVKSESGSEDTLEKRRTSSI